MCPLLGFTGWNKEFVTSGFAVAIICASVRNTDIKAGSDGRQLDIVRWDFALKCANFIILQTIPADRQLLGKLVLLQHENGNKAELQQTLLRTKV